MDFVYKKKLSADKIKFHKHIENFKEKETFSELPDDLQNNLKLTCQRENYYHPKKKVGKFMKISGMNTQIFHIFLVDKKKVQ